jgi:hypothetical protein
MFQSIQSKAPDAYPILHSRTEPERRLRLSSTVFPFGLTISTLCRWDTRRSSFLRHQQATIAFLMEERHCQRPQVRLFISFWFVKLIWIVLWLQISIKISGALLLCLKFSQSAYPANLPFAFTYLCVLGAWYGQYELFGDHDIRVAPPTSTSFLTSSMRRYIYSVVYF